MLRSHLIQFLGEIESHEQAPGLKLVPSLIMSGPLGPLIFGLCAGPLPIGLTLKSVEKLHFSHHGSLLLH